MKKNVCIAAAAIVLALGLTSCSKSYNCHCVYKTNGNISNEDDKKISEGKREKSAAACDQGDATSSQTLNGTTYVNTTECELTD